MIRVQAWSGDGPRLLESEVVRSKGMQDTSPAYK